MSEESTTVLSRPNIKPSRVPKVFSAMRHRNFQLYFGGQLVSNAGTWMQVIAQGWLVYELTHSEFALGVVSFASALPVLIVSLWGGMIVDRFPKRTLLVITQASAMCLAFILAGLTFTGLVREWHIILLAALLGVVNAVDAPARQAIIVEMVGKEDLPNAIAMNSMMFNSARIIGPSIAGILLAILGAGWCFTINAVSYIAVIAGLLAMKMPPHRANPISGSPLNQVSSGIKYVLRNPDLWGLLLLASVFGVFGISYSNILPAFAEDFLKSGATGYGALNAFMGVGALVGAFLVALYSDSGKRGAMLNIANLFYPIVLGVFAWVPHLLPSLGLICLLGVGFMVQMAMTNTLLQTSVDDEYRGRVMSLYALTFFGFSPFGSLLIGTLAQNWGSSIAIGICAVITWVVSRWVMLRTPRIRKLP